MQGLLPILFASTAGIGHAFEPDHLLAVGNLISRRDTLVEALRDGIYWGLGHAATLVLVGSIIMLGRVTFTKRMRISRTRQANGAAVGRHIKKS